MVQAKLTLEDNVIYLKRFFLVLISVREKYNLGVSVLQYCCEREVSANRKRPDENIPDISC